MLRPAIVMTALLWFSCMSGLGAQTIRLDLAQTDQQVLGFGGQIWAGDARGRTAMVELDARFARLQHGVNFFTFPTQPPTDSNLLAGDNFTDMKSYIAANFNGPGGNEPWHLPSIKSTQTWANVNNVELIINEFQIAYGFLNSGHTQMETSRVDDYATFWAALLSYLADNNVHPSYIELANEPNGTWNGRITNTDYNTLAKQTRTVLDAHGFTNIGILGPGLNVLGETSWVNALDANGVQSLAGWSTHTWDYNLGIDARASLFENAIEAKDPNKPVFITEYATSLTEFNGVSFSSPESGGNAADQPEFAVQVVKNTLSLVNHGASALILWEAADQSWSNKRWGLKRLDGTNRPTQDAMKSLLDLLPDNATAIEQTWNDSEITAAGFIKDGELIVALANPLNEAKSRTLELANSSGVLQFDRGLQYSDGMVTPLTYAVSEKSVSLQFPAASTQTLVFKILAPIPGDFDLDGRVGGDDISHWQAGYGRSSGAGIGDGDADNDGDVDGFDFLLWQRNFGTSLPIQAATASLPEPGLGWPVTVAALAFSDRISSIAMVTHSAIPWLYPTRE